LCCGSAAINLNFAKQTQRVAGLSIEISFVRRTFSYSRNDNNEGVEEVFFTRCLETISIYMPRIFKEIGCQGKGHESRMAFKSEGRLLTTLTITRCGYYMQDSR
jgi:hypothetical protein